MKSSVLRPFIEKFLQEFLQSSEPVEADEDGAYRFRQGSAGIVITLQDGDPGLVSVWSPLLQGVKKSPALLDALNDINAESALARVYWDEEDVILQFDLLPESLDGAQMEAACSLVADMADDLDTKLKKRFRGKMTFPDDQEEDDEAKV